MSSGPKKQASSLTFDKILMDKLRPAYFGTVNFLDRIAKIAIFCGLLGYVLAQLKAQNIDLIQQMFSSQSLQFLK